MVELRGMPVVKHMAERFSNEVNSLVSVNVIPTLAVVRVGEREDDIAYERGIIKRFENVAAKVKIIKLDKDVCQDEFDTVITGLNEDRNIHGILVFKPLPKHLSDERLKELIDPKKDVDCIHMSNVAKVFVGDEDVFPPCTAQAVMELLDFYNVILQGKKVVIVGRSMVVGRPLAMLLLKKNATVTICHTKTVNLAKECKEADILIACAGCAKMIKEEFTHPKQMVIDVGINFEDGVMCGDVDSENVRDKVKFLTPVPGGVGTVTTSVLLKHTILSAKKLNMVK